MSNNGGPSTSQHVMSVLQTLYVDPDPVAKKRAGEWLEEFQHSEQAWQTCHELLSDNDSPLEGRLFSAQTFRAKITYDLAQLPREQLPPLRDSLIAALTALTSPTAPTGSRAVSTQLSLALSDLAIQMPEWENVVQGMIDQFGSDARTVGVLLGFLKCLVEESGNPRIAISSEQARSNLTHMISGNAESVLGVLAMYIQAQGLTAQITTAIFETLSSWLAAGEIIPSQVAQTPLFESAFTSLSSNELFDPAVDLLCDLIHETQEIDDNVDVIQIIIPRLVALRPELKNHTEDADRIRGYCRLFCEAGETYTDLIARHPDDLLALVEAVAECAAYEDLEIVQITFNFWYNLATALGRTPQDPRFQPILAIYANLQSVIISRLHFPGDDEQQTAQERDEFRMFRHRMGDTLKDCCHVLGATVCLRKSFDMVASALSKPTPSWQEIEAPLFSMRSMGAEVDNDDEEVLPHIMEMLPQLPDHPRIRYAAILVISRYTQWINRHPQNLAFQLQYVSAGFEIADENVSAAAAQAMKFMCQDCHSHLVPFLPQLHTFVGSVGDKLEQADMVEVMEAIGYVVSSMPAEEGAQALQQFSQPLLQRVQAASPTEGKEGLMKVADALEQLDSLLTPIRTLSPFPASCYPTAAAVYGIFDSLLQHHSKTYFISDRLSSTIRRGLAFFPPEALQPILQALMERMASCFDETGFACYLWIIGKVTSKFGEAAIGPGGDELAGLLGGAFEKVTQVLARRLGEKTAVEMPDVMDDYSHLLMSYLTTTPSLTLSLPSLPLAITHVLSSLSCPSPSIVRISLDVLSKLATSLPNPTLTPIFQQYGKGIITLVLQGLIQDFPEDSMEEIERILVGTLGVCGSDGEVYVGEALSGVGGTVVPANDRGVFMGELHEYLSNPTGDRLRIALRNLVRAARRQKERGRQSRKSMGA